jgi:uncharacterized protein
VTAARVVALLIAVPLLGVAVAWLAQGRLIYLPYGDAGSPGAAGLPDAQAVQLATADRLQLDAWYVPPARGATGAGVLMLPGNAGNRSLRAPLPRSLADRGLAVLLVEYRGYSRNPGRPSETGLLADAAAGHAWLAARPGVDRITVFGESLGAAVAARLAAATPVHGVVLRSPFTSLADVGALHYPFLPVRQLLRDRFDVVEAVRAVDAPVVVVAGERDSVVPPEQSQRVADAAGARFVMVAGADHNDSQLASGTAVLDAIVRVSD